MTKIYDDILEEHYAKKILNIIDNVHWSYKHQVTTVLLNKHWTHTPDTWAAELFDKFGVKEEYNAIVSNCYLIGYNHGIETQIHTDDGDLTMIYYPDLNWKSEWGGGTMIYNDDYGKGKGGIDEHISYKGNRLVVFDAWRKHQGQPISKQCYELRRIVVFKCYIEGASRERLDFYND